VTDDEAKENKERMSKMRSSRYGNVKIVTLHKACQLINDYFGDHEKKSVDFGCVDVEKREALGVDAPDELCFPSVGGEDSKEIVEQFQRQFRDIEEWALEDEWEAQTFQDFKEMERWKV